MDDEKPIEGAQDADQRKNERPAGAAEGHSPEPSTDEVAEMYKELGIKAPVPTGKSKGRPKADAGGDKKAAKKDDASGAAGKGQADDDGKDKSKAASASDSDGSDGNDADSKSKKVSSKDGKDGKEDPELSGDGGEDEDGVSDSKSKDNGKAAKSGEGADGDEDGGDGEDGGKSGAASEENEEGKRPGKSNPAVEARIQKLANEKKAAEERANALEKQLREETQAKEQAKISQEDPEYTVADFRTVRDNKTGEIRELTPEQAELAWRRWKDGFEQRAQERQAKANYATRVQEHFDETSRNLMKKSADAYDALAGLMDEYPELVSTSGKFDEDFAAEAMPIINEAVEYLEGTEPGNAEGKLPVIVGLRIDPKKILGALKRIESKKRNLPLNGVNDSVDRGSGVNVPHSRSSDPTVNAANELYKELGIKKRI
jgi:hypothetical protein